MNLSRLLITSVIAILLAVPVIAERVLRLDEVAIGQLDPGKATDYADSMLMFNVYDTLVLPRQGGPGHVPHLATSWSGEGTKYTFNLRQDVKFQSGNALTADDVVFSLERMVALGQGFANLFLNVNSIEAVDDYTVQFELEQPYAPFISSLVRLPIIDKQLIMANLGDGEGEMGDWGQEFLSSKGAGTGAYIVKSHNPLEETIMVKNPDYFLDIAEKAPDTVRLRYGLEAPTVRTLIARGEHDISSQWIPPEVMRSLAESGNQLLFEGGSSTFYHKMNTTKAPLDDVHCRMALTNALDYEGVIKIIKVTDDVSGGTPTTGAITVGMFGSNPADQILVQDLVAAKKHLDMCQYDPADFSIEISWVAEVPLEERLALLLQSNLAEIGIKSTVRKIPWALFSEMVSTPENTPHISSIYVTAVTGDPDTLLYLMYHSSAAGTWQSTEHLNDAEVDALLEAGRSGATDSDREAAYSALNKKLMELAPTIYVYDVLSLFVARPNIKVPALSDPAFAFGLDSMGFSFRLIEVD